MNGDASAQKLAMERFDEHYKAPDGGGDHTQYNLSIMAQLSGPKPVIDARPAPLPASIPSNPDAPGIVVDAYLASVLKDDPPPPESADLRLPCAWIRHASDTELEERLSQALKDLKRAGA